MDIRSLSRIIRGRGHIEAVFDDSGIINNGVAWAAATEWDEGRQIPKNGGAHVTVQQVVPAFHRATVRVWVDNVGIDIPIRVTLFIG